MADRYVTKLIAYSSPLIGSLNANLEVRSAGDEVRVSRQAGNAATFSPVRACVETGLEQKASSSNVHDYIAIRCAPVIEEWTDELEIEFDNLAVDFAVGNLDDAGLKTFRQLESIRNRFLASGSESFMLHEQIKAKRIRELKDAIRKYFRPITVS